MIPDTSTKAEAAGRAHAHALVALEGLPVALVVAVTAALAWAGGSILSGAWLGWESLVGLALAAVLISGAAAAPPRAAVIGLTGLFGLAGWDALSLRWSPVPSLARDEALLVLFYVLAALIVAVSLRTEDGRTIAAALVVAAAGALGVATAIELALGAHPENLYDGGRLSAPIGYANGQAAAFALAFWPAVALAASRRLPVAARAVLFACAGVCIAGWIATQSKAAGVGLAAGGILLFAVSRERLRLLVPAVLAAAIGAAAYRPVTAPYRAVEAGAAAAARHAGRSWLLVAAEAVGVGLAYAAADRTIVVAPRVRRLAAIAVAVLVAAGAAGGAAAIALHVRHPESYVAAKWHAFKWPPASETGSSHFETLGSDRYDMWRVAFDAFRAHPIAGIGARGFGVLYLQKASIQRSPARSHSLELDALSETGIIGFALLALGLGGLFVAAAAGSRTRAVSAAIVASAVGWLVQASVDWTWTLPACTLPLFVLLGVGASRDRARRPARRGAVLLAGAVIAVVVVGFLPPWLASRDVAQAYAGSPAWESELNRAHTLDPLSIDPLVARAELAPHLGEAAAALRQAIGIEPKAVQLYYLLGIRYLRAGDRARAIVQLEHAKRLAPRDTFVRNALWEARHA